MAKRGSCHLPPGNSGPCCVSREGSAGVGREGNASKARGHAHLARTRSAGLWGPERRRNPLNVIQQVSGRVGSRCHHTWGSKGQRTLPSPTR